MKNQTPVIASRERSEGRGNLSFRFLVLSFTLLLAACEMERQPKYTTYRKSTFFADNSSARMPVEGAVARGDIPDIDTALETEPPVIDAAGLASAKLNYDIYCDPCHGADGRGNGRVISRGFPNPRSLTSEDILSKPPKDLFNTIMHGYKNSPPFDYALDSQQGWELVRYIQSLKGGADGKEK